MPIHFQVNPTPDSATHALIGFTDTEDLDHLGLTQQESLFVSEAIKRDSTVIELNKEGRILLLCPVKDNLDPTHLEKIRLQGHKAYQKAATHHLDHLLLLDAKKRSRVVLSLAEGLALSAYSFSKYFRDPASKQSKLTTITFTDTVTPEDAHQLSAMVDAVFAARDLVNEPANVLTAEQLGREVKALADQSGFTVDILNKKQIESLKMGGVLAVNKGSVDPPVFIIMEHAPQEAVNEYPIVLVGKGIVYDTGGLSLKPTPNSMDFMKSDMAGAAAVIGAVHGAALQKLPVRVIGLVPATDNRPGGNAFAPGDIITMHNGSTVEIKNTDAEGRMVLADALTYAQKYKPELVLDFATLTGSAAMAIGTQGSVAMGELEAHQQQALTDSGNLVHERLAWMPFWPEYADEMKSDIADLNNLGGRYAGAITAGKFLQHFTLDTNQQPAYPWAHFDIAGPAFLTSAEHYRPKGGTGTGVRLLLDFLKKRTHE